METKDANQYCRPRMSRRTSGISDPSVLLRRRQEAWRAEFRIGPENSGSLAGRGTINSRTMEDLHLCHGPTWRLAKAVQGRQLCAIIFNLCIFFPTMCPTMYCCTLQVCCRCPLAFLIVVGLPAHETIPLLPKNMQHFLHIG